MSNANNPFGFQLIKSEGKENRVRYYAKSSGVALYPGDVVELNASGEVELSEGDDTMLGVSAGYSAAASTDKVAIIDDPEAEFMVQCDGNFSAADVGQNANATITAGDSTLKTSNHSLKSSSMAVTATLQWKILGLYDRGTNAVGSYAIVRVKPNNHAFKAGVEGI